MKKELRMVRMPNESFFSEMKIDMSDFKMEKEFPDEMFGWYHNTYIAIKKLPRP